MITKEQFLTDQLTEAAEANPQSRALLAGHIYTGTRRCPCGELVSESWWERHQAGHNHKEEVAV